MRIASQDQSEQAFFMRMMKQERFKLSSKDDGKRRIKNEQKKRLNKPSSCTHDLTSIRICLIASIAVRIFRHFIVKIAEKTRFVSHLNLLRFFLCHSLHFYDIFLRLCRRLFPAYYSDTFALHITTSEDYRQNTKMFVWKPVSRKKERTNK